MIAKVFIEAQAILGDGEGIDFDDQQCCLGQSLQRTGKYWHFISMRVQLEQEWRL